MTIRFDFKGVPMSRKRFYGIAANVVCTGSYVIEFLPASSKSVRNNGKNRPKLNPTIEY